MIEELEEKYEVSDFEFIMELGAIRDNLDQFRKLANERHELLMKKMSENFKKMMEGFACVEAAFKMNCGAQIAFAEDLAEARGTIAEDPWDV